MNKPTTVLRQEFIETQINMINNSGLPAFVLVDIMEEVLVALRNNAAEQYKKDKAEWEQYKKDKAELDEYNQKKEENNNNEDQKTE